MNPAQQSKARLGRLHLVFSNIQICDRLLNDELLMVTMYTAHISSNGSHFLTARVWQGMDKQNEWLLCTLSILHI